MNKVTCKLIKDCQGDYIELRLNGEIFGMVRISFITQKYKHELQETLQGIMQTLVVLVENKRQ